MIRMRYGSMVYSSGVMKILLTKSVLVGGADTNLRYHEGSHIDTAAYSGQSGDWVQHWNAGL